MEMQVIMAPVVVRKTLEVQLEVAVVVVANQQAH